MDRVRSTLKAVVITGSSLQSPALPSDEDKQLNEELGVDGNSDSDSASSGHSSCSDEEISDVLDETEIQLIEAMEDSQVPSALNNAKNSTSATAADLGTTLHPPQLLKAAASSGSSILSTSPRKGLSWVGLGENVAGASRTSYTDSLKVRFSSPQKLSNTSICVSSGDVMSSDSDSFSDDSDDSRPDKAKDAANVSLHHKASSKLLGSTSGKLPKTGASVKTASLSLHALSGAHTGKQKAPSTLSSSASTRASDSEPAQTSLTKPEPRVEQVSALKVTSPSVESGSPEGGSPKSYSSEQCNDTDRASSLPLDSVEFVAPGVTKQTAMSLLRRVLDIDGPVIQQKMVEFLLIDGVIASLIGFITHCQGSIYSPSSSTTSQTVPSSPSQHKQDSSEFELSPKSTSTKDLPLGMLKEFELRSQHRTRLQRQRSRSTGLTETDLRRGYNAAQMLASSDQYACRVVEAKLGVIVPCLLAVFHRDSLGSFHHACLLLEHCFSLSPLKTTRLLLYQQNTPSRWWSMSESVAKGLAPICDILPYLSEPCVQRLFSKAEFGVWTGRLMTSLNLLPNDAIVVSDELNRMGLGSVASVLGAKGGEDNAAKDAQSQQRAKALQLVRNRFQQLNRGGFFDQILDLIEDSDPQISASVAEFMAYMINDCSTFYGFNLLFKPIYDSELSVRRLAQLIVNSPSQRLSAQACAATRLLYALLAKTSCQYGRRTRDAQGIRDPELYPRGSQVLLQVSQAARNALKSFLPGLLATVTGLQGDTDLTSHCAFNRRASIESLRLPEYEETDPDLDTDDTEAQHSDADESDIGSSDNSGDEETTNQHHSLEEHRIYEFSRREYVARATALEHQEELCSEPQFCSERLSGSIGYATDNSEANENDVNDLRSSAAALLQATYPESIASGSISSSLSPSSTLSASPMAIASSTPERTSDVFSSERLDVEDFGLLVSLPKPDDNRLNLLRICVEVLRECENIDDVLGWVDLRVWRALSTWFLNHPHNNMLHLYVYQLLSIITVEAVRLRQALRRLGIDQRVMAMEELPAMMHNSKLSEDASTGHQLDGFSKQRSSACGIVLDIADIPYSTQGHHHFQENDVFQPETRAQMAARRRARRRREMAERIRHEEASNCDNILTYLIEQNQWADKLIRRAVSPNFDGAHGYISLILNTLRLAVQVDRRRHMASDVSDERTERNRASKGLRPLRSRRRSAAEPSATTTLTEQHPFDTDADLIKTDDCSDGEWHSQAEDEEALLPDLAYHTPETRKRLCEYPMYRLQRWEITLLYSPGFRSHLRTLRDQALDITRKMDEFKLCDQSRNVIANGLNSRRPIPFFSPQKIKAPVAFDNNEIKKKQLQINVGLLLGNGNKRSDVASSSASSSTASSNSSSSSSQKDALKAAGSTMLGDVILDGIHGINEEGVDIDSLYARMLGFTEDLVDELSCNQVCAREKVIDGGKSVAGTTSNGGKSAVTAVTAFSKGASSTSASGSGSTSSSNGKNTKPQRGARKPSIGKSGTGSSNAVRRKKSKSSNISDKAIPPSVAGLLEEIVLGSSNITAEAVCALLSDESSGGGANGQSSAKNAQGSVGRSRKKPVSSSGSVRRRRARLQKSSNPSLNGSSEQVSNDTSSAHHAQTNVVAEKKLSSSGSDLTAPMQSLEIEQTNN
ncbi:hypothetical protein H4R99_005774 [Coemansia sp. RSA 1722]|nr:hypothetical protein H4R99_005774 [Coemansia sp. RSA 1722]